MPQLGPRCSYKRAGEDLQPAAGFGARSQSANIEPELRTIDVSGAFPAGDEQIVTSMPDTCPSKTHASRTSDLPRAKKWPSASLSLFQMLEYRQRRARLVDKRAKAPM
jgi:hypothetical protein